MVVKKGRRCNEKGAFIGVGACEARDRKIRNRGLHKGDSKGIRDE